MNYIFIEFSSVLWYKKGGLIDSGLGMFANKGTFCLKQIFGHLIKETSLKLKKQVENDIEGVEQYL